MQKDPGDLDTNIYNRAYLSVDSEESICVIMKCITATTDILLYELVCPWSKL